MKAKIFFASFLATILAVGVIATPTPVDVVDSQVTPPADNNVIENNGQAFATWAAPDPRPTGPIITPGENDVPTASSNDVVARDLESLEKRTNGCIFMTTDSNFNGQTGTACNLPEGRCVNLTPYWRYHVSSFRPDKGNACIMYTGPNCSVSRSDPFVWPGYKHLGPFNDNLGSIKCWWG